MLNTIMLLAMAAVAAVVIACGGSDDNDNDGRDQAQEATPNEDLQAVVDDLRTQLEGVKSRLDFHDDQIQRSAMLGAMTTLHVEALHDLDDTLQSASEVPAGSADSTERMLRAMQLAVWPDDMQERTHGLEDVLDGLMDALRADNLSVAKEHATEAHEMWHDVESEIYGIIGGSQPAHEHGEDGSHATPVPTPAP